MPHGARGGRGRRLPSSGCVSPPLVGARAAGLLMRWPGPLLRRQVGRLVSFVRPNLEANRRPPRPAQLSALNAAPPLSLWLHRQAAWRSTIPAIVRPALYEARRPVPRGVLNRIVKGSPECFAEMWSGGFYRLLCAHDQDPSTSTLSGVLSSRRRYRAPALARRLTLKSSTSSRADACVGRRVRAHSYSRRAAMLLLVA